MLEEARAALRKQADPERAEFLKGFFRTCSGGYGEGDRLLGVTVPKTREIARQFRSMPLKEVIKLLQSKFHEERLLALVLLSIRFAKGDRAEVHRVYLDNLRYINNWDLVDVSAPLIVGEYFLDPPAKKAADSDGSTLAVRRSSRAIHLRARSFLSKLARSKNLWERRISIISTLAFIRAGQTAHTLAISKILLKDREDLIQKAVGWMLREAWKREPEPVEDFLTEHHHEMPRTMLRYAIEKMPQEQRLSYLHGTVA